MLSIKKLKEKEYRLYVSKLPRSISEDDFKNLFEPFGETLKAKLMVKDEATNSGNLIKFSQFA